MIKKHVLTKAIIALVLLFGFSSAFAVLPPKLDYQAFLTDDSGAPIDGNVDLVFSFYNVDLGGIPLLSQTISGQSVNQGVLSVELGPFPPGFFDEPLWIGVKVGTDAEMFPRRPITSTGYAFKAGDADFLDGISASALDQSAHVGDIGNPHNVTAAQLGAVSSGDLSAHEGDPSAHHLKTTTFPELSGQISDGQIPALIARDSEIVPTMLANDGPGSSLNADLLDGLDSSAFMPIGTDAWVNVTGDTMTGQLTLQSGLIIDNGGFTFDSGSDIRIHDNINGFRWYDTAGTNQFAGFIISSSAIQFLDYNNAARKILYSNASGIGVGTTPAAGFDVTVPSLYVTDDITSPGTGSASGINLGSDQATPARLWHESDALRIDAPNDRIQYGSVEYIEDCGGNCTEIGFNLNVTGTLDVEGNYATVAGAGSEQAYIGGDGAGSDVQVGSNNGAITAVALWNRNTGARMDLHARQIHIYGGADLAEPFDFSDEIDVEPGTIVSIDPENPGLLRVAGQSYDRMVAGIVSGAKGIEPGVKMMQEGTETEGSVSVALTGRVYALVDASYGAVEPGDLLTTSNTPGHAMRVSDHTRSQGSIIGKAMTSLKQGTGHVLVLVTLQ